MSLNREVRGNLIFKSKVDIMGNLSANTEYSFSHNHDFYIFNQIIPYK